MKIPLIIYFEEWRLQYSIPGYSFDLRHHQIHKLVTMKFFLSLAIYFFCHDVAVPVLFLDLETSSYVLLFWDFDGIFSLKPSTFSDIKVDKTIVGEMLSFLISILSFLSTSSQQPTGFRWYVLVSTKLQMKPKYRHVNSSGALVNMQVLHAGGRGEKGGKRGALFYSSTHKSQTHRRDRYKIMIWWHINQEVDQSIKKIIHTDSTKKIDFFMPLFIIRRHYDRQRWLCLWFANIIFDIHNCLHLNP